MFPVRPAPRKPADRPLTIQEIDRRIGFLNEAIRTFMAGGVPAIHPLVARDLIDEFLDLRLWHVQQLEAERRRAA